MKKQTASANNGNSRRNASSAPNNNNNNTNSNPPQELYQNLVTDYGFKTVFTKKHFLISFLNEILQGKEKIKSVEQINTQYFGKTPLERVVIFDIHCKNDKGEFIVLEMQKFHQRNFFKRSVFYATRLIQAQGKKGKWEYDYKAVYLIGILNFVDKCINTNGNVVSRIHLKNETNEIVSDVLNFIYVTLPKFSKRADELETPLDYWLHALTHSQPNRQIDEKVLRGNKLFAELLDTIDLNKLNESEMKKYQANKITFESMRPYMTGHYDDGVEDGMQRGLQQGMQQERQQTALNALKKGLSLQDIADITSLPISELEEIKSQL